MVETRPGAVLPVDKPSGPTSHDVVARARRALDEGRIGHTGTLDPFASGLLLLCVGAATRLSEYLTDLDKTYEATALLGRATETLDPEGAVVDRDDGWRALEPARVRDALSSLTGELDQVPPQYSAKKVGGEAMHRRARRGERVELDAVRIRVHELALLELDLPRIRFRVRCSSGTYVRALARDLAASLGTCGHLERLRRTRIGDFRVEDAVAMAELDRAGAVEAVRLDPAEAVAHLPPVRVDAEAAARMAQGQAVEFEPPDASSLRGPLAALVDGTLVAMAEWDGSRLRPRKVFVRV